VAAVLALGLAGCAGAAAPFQDADSRIADSVEPGTATWASKTHAFAVDPQAAALVVRGDFRFTANTTVAVDSGTGVGCASDLPPAQWRSRDFFCSWVRGGAEWPAQWNLTVGSAAPGTYSFGVYSMTADDLDALSKAHSAASPMGRNGTGQATTF
jgi:hypothetical protein